PPPGAAGGAGVEGEPPREPATERRAVDGRHYGLGAALDRREHAVEVGRLRRLAELADVGARDESAATADDDHGTHRGIGDTLGEVVEDPLADSLRARVHGPLLYGDDT